MWLLSCNRLWIQHEDWACKAGGVEVLEISFCVSEQDRKLGKSRYVIVR